MNIVQGTADVGEQMRALHEYAMLTTGEDTSRLLLFISIVGAIITLFEFVIKMYELYHQYNNLFQEDLKESVCHCLNSNLNEIICLTNRMRF